MAVKGPTFGMMVEVDMAAEPGLADALLERCRMPRQGKPLNKVVVETNDTHQLKTLTISSMQHAAMVLRLEDARPNHCKGL
eukprot:3248626-Prymnesium_polylepis.1